MPRKKLVLKAPTTVSPARFEAFTILMEVERGQAHADDLLRNPRISALSAQDRNLCTTLVMGTLRWQSRLDALIRTVLSRPNARLDPAIRIALRLGLLQLQYLDRIPAHAAISESVNLAKLAGHQFAARMVNAVLRMLSGHAKPDPLGPGLSTAELAEATAHPLWLVERWAAHYGLDVARNLCRQGQQQPELAIRCTGPEPEGVTLEPGKLITAARRLVSGDVAATAALQEGRIRIQEEGSQLIAELAGHGSTILDCCAAPGGKTLVLAERNPSAQVVACEISPARCKAMQQRLAGLHPSALAAHIELREADATQLPDGPVYDIVLADVPCSGTGTLGRNPEIRHRLKPEDLARHHARQVAILRAALRITAPGGSVLYSTCSVEPEENESVVAEVLADAHGWQQLSLATRIQELKNEGRLTESGASDLLESLAADGSLHLLPGKISTDGFFAALLQRSS